MGLQMPMYRDPTNTFVPDDTVERLPKSIDYRKLGYVTSVKNQVSKPDMFHFFLILIKNIIP